MGAPLTCDHCEDLLLGYLLSTFEAVEAAAVTVHLHACARCQASLAAYEVVVDRLAHAVPSHEPSVEVQQRLTAAVTDTPPAARRAPAPSQPHGWTAWWSRWAYVWHWPRFL